jgi:hypothetical protein
VWKSGGLQVVMCSFCWSENCFCEESLWRLFTKSATSWRRSYAAKPESRDREGETGFCYARYEMGRHQVDEGVCSNCFSF